ncbi:hypothetical protein, conserved [Eimeria maxima]|uniref:Nudix hydrolase domain-containing protein n=1 Tax=Eimeria maxima TaxID=5804 RepID=U6LZR4_EIMMA|nr:hypothetical protein, conserved [Eimeria maxima]CDJ57457.1 hypothetical protein, conserved [Eimeria maxima]
MFLQETWGQYNPPPPPEEKEAAAAAATAAEAAGGAAVSTAAAAADAASYIPLSPVSSPHALHALQQTAAAALRGEEEGRINNLRGFILLNIINHGLLLMLKEKINKYKQVVHTPQGDKIGYLQLPGGHADWTDFPAARQRFIQQQQQQQQQQGEKVEEKGGDLVFCGHTIDIQRMQHAVAAAIEERVQQQHEQQPQLQREHLLQQQLLLQEWARIGAVRELLEETGIDLRHDPDLLLPLPPIYGKRVAAFFFLLQLQLPAAAMITEGGGRGDDDNVAAAAVAANDDDVDAANKDNKHKKSPYVTQGPLGAPSTHPLMLRIDHREHAGFVLQPDLEKAAEDVQYHSGGRASRAVMQLLTLIKKER